MSGAISGAASGAALGTAVLPGIGTAIGGIAGGLFGFLGQQSTNATNIAAVEKQIEFQQQSQQEAERYNTQQAGVAMDYNSQQAQLQRDYEAQMQREGETWSMNMVGNQEQYETNMSNTAYQRSVRDMKAAGLNPILGVASGGASTPSVASPSMGAPSGATAAAAPSPTVGMQPGAHAVVSSSLQAGINSAVSAARTINDIESTSSQIDLNRAQADKLSADAGATRAAIPGIAAHSGAQQLEPAQAAQTLENSLQQLTNLKQQAATEIARQGQLSASTQEALSGVTANIANARRAMSDADYQNTLTDFAKRTNTRMPEAPTWLKSLEPILPSSSGTSYNPGGPWLSDTGNSVVETLKNLANTWSGGVNNALSSAKQVGPNNTRAPLSISPFMPPNR